MQSISSKLSRLRNKNLNINAGDFGKQASMAAYLIDAGISAPVLKIKIGSFDTHENQTWRHRRLLQDLSKGLSGLRRALKQSGHWENTLIMTYSEFGRRAKENESGGTDHGTAAPHFLMSGSLEGGLWGIHPDLGNLKDGDVQFTTDYRVIYDKILSDWFGLKQNRFENYRSNITDGLFS